MKVKVTGYQIKVCEHTLIVTHKELVEIFENIASFLGIEINFQDITPEDATIQ